MEIILATNNSGKVLEFNRILKDCNLTFCTLKDKGINIFIDETEDTFLKNATLKAMTVYKKMKIPTLADDSGLVVEALNGRPGVRSARFYSDNATDEQNNNLLLELMHQKKNRNAKFVCALSLVIDENTILTSKGECNGTISTQKIGNGGFGYDCLFLVDGKTFAQMSEEQKDFYSHRNKAILNIKQELIKFNNK